MNIYHNLVPHDLRCRKLITTAWKDAKSGSQFNAIFSLPLIEKADRLLLGGKPKTKGQHNFNAVSTENETVAVSFSFGENVRIYKRKSMCQVGVQSSLDRF
eukprot:TRINITY_DN1819_c0_g1_i19.p1 TRINITY_DN1819_c0_g1~~TRINITY_DN1819_c0_g1_i19.p1  ORF type:complete len:101 (-),score=3.27 TRINITY_DN1819_c0_g1_i19:1441-1743(-)